MSKTIPSLSEQEKMSKKPFHHRNDSHELDVFEASRYFSGADEGLGGNFSQKSMKEQHASRLQAVGGRRMSLDIPSMKKSSIPSQIINHAMMEEKPIKEKKFKQPSSPGGKLASFLNSLFNQTSSKKKKSKSTTQSMKDNIEDESPGWRRKRRSSISTFRSGNSNSIISDSSNSKSIYSTTSSTTSGFRTPPPYGYTTTKSYKDQKPEVFTGLTNGLTKGLTKPIVGLDEKFKFRDGLLEKNKNLGNGLLEKGRILAEKCQTEERENYKRFNGEDDGEDSDSSSDLFELTNCDLGYYSSGLPVYETTHMDSIKRGAPISSGGPI